MTRLARTLRALALALHRLLPRRFRDEYGAELQADLDASLDRAPGAWGRARAGGAAVIDAARAIPREWVHAVREGPGTTDMTTGDTIMGAVEGLRRAARSLAKRPWFTLTAALTLGLGIGANVAIFTVLDGVVLSPLPYPDADELVTVVHHAPGIELPELEGSPGMIGLYRSEAEVFAELAGWQWTSRNLVGGRDPERLTVIEVEPALFDVLRTPPALGRPFRADDVVREGPARVAILTHARWAASFGSDPDVIGRTVDLDGVATEVIGVMPEGFAFPDPGASLYLPLWVDPAGPFGRFGIRVVARLAPGADLAAAQARIDALQARIPEAVADAPDLEFLEESGWSVDVLSLKDRLVGDEIASALWVVVGTVAFVLLIACANVANLFLVRAEARQREMAVRAALGAGRTRLAGAWLAESVVLGALGGALGVGLAWLGVRLLTSYGPAELPRLHEVALSPAGLGLAAVAALVSAVVLGTLPLLRDIGGGGPLREGARGATAGRERHRVRNALVASQLGLAVMLLVASGLMLRSFQAITAVEPGIDTDDVLTVGISIASGTEPMVAAELHARLAGEVAALPGVESVGVTTAVPMTGGGFNGGSFDIEGRPTEDEDLPPVALYKAVGRDYFEAVRQPVLAGRTFTESDWRDGPAVAVVNESFARQFFDGDALGEAVSWTDEGEWARIVGVVADVREMGATEEIRPIAYLPLVVGDWGFPNLTRGALVIRSSPGTPVPVAAVRDVVRRVDPGVPVTTVRTLAEVRAEGYAATSFTLVLLGLAAGVALFLGAIGLFGVISYVVAQRTREIGVRVALGANHADIRSMILRQGSWVTALGLTLGLGAALASSRLMGSVLYEVSTLDPVAFVTAPGLLGAVALLAMWIPARRAARVDPVVALATE